MDKWKDELFGNVIKAAILWVLLQVICGWRNFWPVFVEQPFDLGHWAGTGLYVLALLVLDLSIYRFCDSGTAKGWAKYWVFCMAVVLLARLVNGTDVFDATLETLLIFASPYYALSPLWSFIGGHGHAAVVLALCAAHLTCLLFLFHRVKKNVQQKEG